MKKVSQVSVFISVTIFFLLLNVNLAQASAPPPPPPPHGQTGDQPGNAPIGSGMGLFILAATAYGVRKMGRESAIDQ